VPRLAEHRGLTAEGPSGRWAVVRCNNNACSGSENAARVGMYETPENRGFCECQSVTFALCSAAKEVLDAVCEVCGVLNPATSAHGEGA
jgi:hypothetical protein